MSTSLSRRPRPSASKAAALGCQTGTTQNKHRDQKLGQDHDVAYPAQIHPQSKRLSIDSRQPILGATSVWSWSVRLMKADVRNIPEWKCSQAQQSRRNTRCVRYGYATDSSAALVCNVKAVPLIMVYKSCGYWRSVCCMQDLVQLHVT